jgi:hypothetical protein
VKLVPLIVLGAMSSVKTATIEEFVAAPAVGPGLVVAGTVRLTRGLVESGSGPVVNVHTNGVASARPVAALVAPVIVAVYSVSGSRVTPSSVKLAVSPALSRATVPVGLTQGAAQDTVNDAPPVKGSIRSLNSAVKAVVFVETFVARSAGVGAVATGRATAMSPPKMASFPHPVENAYSSTVAQPAITLQVP